MSKLYCLNHEGFTEGYTCNKCNSINVYQAGVNTRFPKHPKKRDFVEIFQVLINTAIRSANINDVKVIHKYITNHKYGNVSAYDIFGERAVKDTYKERMEVILKNALESNRTRRENNTIDKRRYLGRIVLNEKADKLFDYIVDKGKRTKGFTVEAFDIILSSNTYDSTSDTNYFRPKPVNQQTKENYYVFKNKKEAATAATYLAKEYLKSSISTEFENTRFTEKAISTAAKKYDLEKEFAQFFI